MLFDLRARDLNGGADGEELAAAAGDLHVVRRLREAVIVTITRLKY